MNKIKHILKSTLFFFIILQSNLLFSQNISNKEFYNQFEFKVFKELHLYLPIRNDNDFHRLDPYPYKGKEIQNELIKELFNDEYAEYHKYYAIYSYMISPNFDAFIIRKGGEAQLFHSSIDLYIFEKDRKSLIQIISLAGYDHGDGGGGFWESWIKDINNDGFLDVITREKFESRIGAEAELISRDEFKIYIWQQNKYIEYSPRNKDRFFSCFPFYNYHLNYCYIWPQDIDSSLNEDKSRYVIIISSDIDLEAARFEVKRFNNEFGFQNITIYYLTAYPQIYRKGDRYYTIIFDPLYKNEAELLLLDIKKVFTTAWIVNWEKWCEDYEFIVSENYYKCLDK